MRTRLGEPTTAAPPAASVRFTAASGRAMPELLEEGPGVDLFKMRAKMAKMGKASREGTQFKGKIVDTTTRELKELETRKLRKFELYDVNVGNPRAGVQGCNLSAVESFLAVGEPAHKMYKDHVATWESYSDFIGHLYLTFQQPNADQEVIRTWNARKQGN